MKYFKLFLFFFFMTSSFSASGHDGNDYYVTLKAYQLWSNTYSNPRIRVIPKDGVYNPMNCKDPDSYYLRSQLPEEARKRIYSTLLSAIVTGKTIRARIDQRCEGDKPVILHVIIQ